MKMGNQITILVVFLTVFCTFMGFMAGSNIKSSESTMGMRISSIQSDNTIGLQAELGKINNSLNYCISENALLRNETRGFHDWEIMLKNVSQAEYDIRNYNCQVFTQEFVSQAHELGYDARGITVNADFGLHRIAKLCLYIEPQEETPLSPSRYVAYGIVNNETGNFKV
jgi:hypothetical protein